MPMAYDPKAFHARDSAIKHVKYYVNSANDRWFRTAINDTANNSTHNAQVSPSGVATVAS